MYKAKEHFLYYKKGQIIPDEDIEQNPHWIELPEVQEVKDKSKSKVNLDLNGDGKIDKEDASIASKVMNAIKKKKTTKRKKKKK